MLLILLFVDHCFSSLPHTHVAHNIVCRPLFFQFTPHSCCVTFFCRPLFVQFTPAHVAQTILFHRPLFFQFTPAPVAQTSFFVDHCFFQIIPVRVAQTLFVDNCLSSSPLLMLLKLFFVDHCSYLCHFSVGQGSVCPF